MLIVVTLVVSCFNSVVSTAQYHQKSDINDLHEYNQECGTNYSLACLKADIVRLLSLISRSSPYQIMPGISITSSGIRPRLSGLNQRTADDILAKALTDFFRSITIHVALYNDRASALFSDDSNKFSGRLKKYKFLTVYTVFAIAFALLSALVGKAMTLSIVSLIISMIARNGGIGNSPPNSPPQVYDIVRRPHIQFANTHSTEEIYEGARQYSPAYAAPNGYSRLYGVSTATAEPYSSYLRQERVKGVTKNSTKLEI